MRLVKDGFFTIKIFGSGVENMNSKFMRLLVKLVLALLLTICCIIMIYPFIWMVSSSFKEVSELYRMPPTIIPDKPTLDNYFVVFQKMSILANMYKNSIIVATSIPVLQIIVCSAAAFAFAKMKFHGKNILFTLFLSSMMIPGQVTIIPIYVIMRKLHLIDSILSLILLSSFSAFYIFLLRQFFLTLPKDLDDAAKIDGCNYLRSFFSIHMPLAKSVIAVNSILSFNGAWGDFFGPLIFLKSIGNMTLPLGVSMVQGIYSQQSQSVMVATLVIVIIPVIIVFLLGRKQIIAGITTTGLKL